MSDNEDTIEDRIAQAIQSKELHKDFTIITWEHEDAYFAWNRDARCLGVSTDRFGKAYERANGKAEDTIAEMFGEG